MSLRCEGRIDRELGTQESRTQRRAWAAKAAEGGAKLGHSWIMETVGWIQQIAKETDGSWSAEPNDVLRHLCSSWHGLWAAQAARMSITSSLEVPGSPEPLSPEIRTAAGSFKAVSSVTDGFQPRYFQLLSDEAFERLCRLLYAADAKGDTPCAQRSLIVTMLSKPTGGSGTSGCIAGDQPALAGLRGKTAVDPRPSGQSTLPASMGAASRCFRTVFISK